MSTFISDAQTYLLQDIESLSNDYPPIETKKKKKKEKRRTGDWELCNAKELDTSTHIMHTKTSGT